MCPIVERDCKQLGSRVGPGRKPPVPVESFGVGRSPLAFPVLVALLLAVPGTSRATDHGSGSSDAVKTPVVVKLSAPPLGEVNHELLGLSHEPRSATVAGTLATGIPNLAWMRVDAYFDDPGAVTATADAVDLDPTAIDHRLARAEESGAEALLILDYMPPDMAEASCAARSHFYPGANRCPPADHELWKDLVRQAVRHACCGTNLVSGTANRVRWFEVWNEPDFFHFFAGTLADYLRLYRATNEAVREVEADENAARAEAGEPPIDLRTGGGAFLFPDPPWIEGLLALVASSRADPDPSDDLDLDFLSWHQYANSPFFGPLEGVPFTPDADNPLLDAGIYADQTEFVRGLVEPYRGVVDPLLWLDEWNVNAGADDRHEDAYGAAFTAAVLHGMQDAGLDRSVRFNTQDNAAHHTWGMFTYEDADTPGGERKPAFHSFAMWSGLERTRLRASWPKGDVSVDGAGPADRRYRFGAVASRSPDASRITVLLYNFAPYREEVTREAVVTLAGLDGSYTETVHLLDDSVGIGDDLPVLRGPRTVDGPTLDGIVLGPNSVALVELVRDA